MVPPFWARQKVEVETKLCQMGMNEGQEGWDGCGLVYLKYFLGRSSVVVADFQSGSLAPVKEKNLLGLPGTRTGRSKFKWVDPRADPPGAGPAEPLKYNAAKYRYLVYLCTQYTPYCRELRSEPRVLGGYSKGLAGVLRVGLWTLLFFSFFRGGIRDQGQTKVVLGLGLGLGLTGWKG